jgi:tartrate dehydratase beta subunit/fumarate hydratase class I family protein
MHAPKHGGFYLGSIGGPAARLAQDCIKKVEVLDFEDLGMEAVWKIDVVDFQHLLWWTIKEMISLQKPCAL